MPGRAFFVKYSTETNSWLTVQGTQLSETTYGIALETNKIYFLASAYKILLNDALGHPYTGYSFLECIKYQQTSYVHESLLYPASVGDAVRQWDFDIQDWRNWNIRGHDGLGPVWSGNPVGASPFIEQNVAFDYSEMDTADRLAAYGGGFMLKPAVQKTWTQRSPAEDHTCY